MPLFKVIIPRQPLETLYRDTGLLLRASLRPDLLRLLQKFGLFGQGQQATAPNFAYCTAHAAVGFAICEKRRSPSAIWAFYFRLAPLCWARHDQKKIDLLPYCKYEGVQRRHRDHPTVQLCLLLF